MAIPLRLTLRGLGLQVAVETDLLPKQEDGIPDYDAWMRLWACFEPQLLAAVDNEVEIRSRQKPWNDCGEDGGKETDCGANNRTGQICTHVLFALLGALLSQLLGALLILLILR